MEIGITRAGPNVDVIVEWVPFLLRESTPEDGFPKKGVIGKVSSSLLEMGRAIWIEFTGLCPRIPNTLKAHALMAFAREVGGPVEQNQLQEVIFRQYFTDGIFLDVPCVGSCCEGSGPSGRGGARCFGGWALRGESKGRSCRGREPWHFRCASVLHW